jgi:hypothetical protein
MRPVAHPPRLPVIHIGMPKTATKTLQWRLFAGHDEIYYLGRFDGPQFRRQHRQFSACRDALVQQVMHEIAYDKVADPDFDKCEGLLRQALAPALEGDRVPVWSWESYSTDTLAMRRQRARNLKRVFGDARILITLRHPVALLESAFLQQLKRDNVGPGGKVGQPPFHCRIEDWLEKEWQHDVRHHLEYAETIRAYAGQFGIERVHVHLFEDLCSDSEAFFTAICAVLGVSAGQGLELVAGEKDNSAWTQHQLDALAAICRSPWRSLRFRFSERSRRRAMLGLDRFDVPALAGPKARVRIPESWRARIMAATRDGNLWLAQTFQLPLARYGYLEQ